MSFIDEYKRMLWLFLIKTKNEVLEEFKKFKAFSKKHIGKQLKILRTGVL